MLNILRNNIVKMGFLATLIIFIISIIIFEYSENENREKSIAIVAADTKNNNIGPTEITAREAIEIGLNNAKEFIAEPLFINLNSTDSDCSPNINSGSDGKRSAWYVSFGNEGTKRVSYLISNKMIIETHEEDASEYAGSITLERGLHQVSDLIVNSDEAIRIAVEQKGLRPGNPDNPEDWLIGYHYQVANVIMSDDVFDTRFVIIVSGISPKGHLATVTIDEKTGDVLGAGEQVGYDKTGHSLWEAF